jgi:hypothetical protein
MSKNLLVGDDFRTNPLSLKPGGYDITVIYETGKSFTYDKIKNPANYVTRISSNFSSNSKYGQIVEILIDGNPTWSIETRDKVNDFGIIL